MTVIKFSVSRATIALVKRRLKKLGREIQKPHRAHREISISLARWVDQNFKSQGGKVGGWAPFKAKGRRGKGGTFDASAKLLQDTGRLRASFAPFYTRKTAGIGSDLIYSKAHEKGNKRRGLEARRMLPRNSDKEIKAIVFKVYDKHFVRATK
jgi:phage gpG-like protein